LSLALECARTGEPADSSQPARPVRQSVSEFTSAGPCNVESRQLDCPGRGAQSIWARVRSCKRRSTGGTSSECGFFSSGRGWQADGNWQPYRRRVVQRSNPGFRADGLGGRVTSIRPRHALASSRPGNRLRHGRQDHGSPPPQTLRSQSQGNGFAPARAMARALRHWALNGYELECPP
jgi:hypothetical protein